MKTDFFKKALGCLSAFACMIPSSSLWAQEEEFTPLSGAFDFLAVKNIELRTSHVFEYGQIKYWREEGLHAGVQSFGLTLFNCKEIQKNVAAPDNPSFICEIRDMEGNRVERQETELTNVFNKLKFVKAFTENMNVGISVPRGGEYRLVAEISPELFSYETEMILVDEPGIQVFNKSTMVDSLLCPTVTLTSGYPYEPADFSGEKHLHWQITPVSSPTAVIAEGSEIFELKSETPTLAAVATFKLAAENLEPGEYLYTLTSDYAPANYSFAAIINDVLAPEITLDKSVYTVGESKEAVIKVDMDYGYPYVGKGSSSDKPTVVVSAELLNDETSVAYSDETWADSDMHCTAELKVPLEKVNEEVVKEYKGEIPLNISIMFNDVTRFESALILPFEGRATGVKNVTAEKSYNTEVKYYNVFGVEVDESYRGIVISSDGHKIIRKP